MVARAFGAQGVCIAGSRDESLKTSIAKITEFWGGNFLLDFVSSPMHFIKEWKTHGGAVVHLTMYGLPMKETQDSVASLKKDLLVIVGGEKVPGYYYGEADFNVAIGNQPHSEVAALAVFLDRINCGLWEDLVFGNAKKRIIPSERGKNVKQLA